MKGKNPYIDKNGQVIKGQEISWARWNFDNRESKNPHAVKGVPKIGQFAEYNTYSDESSRLYYKDLDKLPKAVRDAQLKVEKALHKRMSFESSD